MTKVYDQREDIHRVKKGQGSIPLKGTLKRRTIDVGGRHEELYVSPRVDFGGGWLDVPKFARPGAFIVNCAISPRVSLNDNPYLIGAGLGGSAIHHILSGKNPLEEELKAGVGWQDPAVIMETGLCVWESGSKPILRWRSDGRELRGKMAILWTGNSHQTPRIAHLSRNYDLIRKAGNIASRIQWNLDFPLLSHLCYAVEKSYEAQLDEGMLPLIKWDMARARKYLGGGWGGYALYIFDQESDRNEFVIATGKAIAIEPYCRWYNGCQGV